MSNPTVIIGGGLAGLTCATQLHAVGVEFILLESSDGVGGRVRTDNVDGFLLDRGFQVLLTAYPEAKRLFDYDALKLQAFEPGSLIRTDNGLHRMSDPWRRPQHVLQTAFAPIGSFADKVRIGRLRWSAGRGTLDSVFERPDCTTEGELRRRGFTQSMVDNFLRPFLGGVFLDQDLQTSCRMMYFVFRMFSQGDTALPADGMEAIPRQLAAGLPEDCVRLNSTVSAIDPDRVTLQSGEVIPCNHVIVATEQPAAARLLPELAASRTPRKVRCVYFSAREPPVADRMLVLNGTGLGVVNNLCVPSQVVSNYAPDGRSLVSATVLKSELDDDSLVPNVTTQMREWFGASVDEWKHLRTYTIPYALPNQTTPAFDPPIQLLKLRDDILVCGDYRTNGSINGAMQSGRLVAEEILKSG
ncbi:MAG: NAD(P)/FAD-dependent oxidoreductase [Fuerstiella sp.]|nr:NAD(P)/FAD-dependent oxidoreductase [Fuerstiella sp.]